MNRPAVRNVRALRTERELAQARRARAQAAGRRRAAASRRAAVAAVLLGLTLGAWVVALVTTLPWVLGLAPTAALLASMVMGRRAAVAGARADAVARRRITQLERELQAVTGWVAPPQRVVGVSPQPGGAEVLTGAAAAAPASGAEPGWQAPAAAGGLGREQEESAPTVADEGAGGRDAAHTRGDQDRDDQDRDGVEAPGTAAAPEPGAQAAEPVAVAPPRPTVAGPATPPQGWHPVQVPAPTYTLAARAPRRAYPSPVDSPVDSDPAAVGAPAPARPQVARTSVVSAAEAEFRPIDLDAVLERRRAAGE